ncbi:MAG: ferrochelatase [Methylococcaceae bacterium]
MTNRAVLLVNLGSPSNPEPQAVRRYLNQFLMDPYVIQLPWLLRRLIASLLVLPTRSEVSSKAYQSVWTPEGSPLILLSEKLKKALQARLEMPVEMAMRYGNPSIESQLLILAQQAEINEILFVPLYPHYAESTVTTSIAEAEQVIKKHKLRVRLKIIEPFYDNADYLSALVDSAKAFLEQPYDHLLFSYHGLPELHITKLDQSKQYCLKQDDCCQVPNEVHKTCYRHQVFKTTECFTAKARLSPEQYSVAFQSRLGRAKWLGPSTEDRLRELAQSGVKNVLVICPAFVTDCLETLEEIAIRGSEVFKEAGGESFTLIPCLNDNPEWVEVLASWCQK